MISCEAVAGAIGSATRRAKSKMEAELFLLTSNAFHVVGASYHSTAAEIFDLVEEAGLSAFVSEAELHKAQHTLLTPRLRLAADITVDISAS
ncbi:hypothetical protein ACC724_37750, partial [Rhizobium ruizarguesonis]